ADGVEEDDAQVRAEVERRIHARAAAGMTARTAQRRHRLGRRELAAPAVGSDARGAAEAELEAQQPVDERRPQRTFLAWHREVRIGGDDGAVADRDRVGLERARE